METRRTDKGMLIGAVLIGFGVLFLLQSFGIVGFLAKTLWGLGFIGGGAAFLSIFAGDKRQWWSLFPAAGLGFVGLSILLPGAGLTGTILFVLMGGAFLAVHFTRRDWVWPLIPGGVMLTLAAVTLLETVSHRIDTGAIFFFGLALTFAAVWYQALDRRYYSWALIVAGILGGVGMLVLIGTMLSLMFKVVVPIGLILLGVYALTDGRMFNKR
ncbi:MAG TPA: hypothetical protein VNT75_04225 [Symbiobacteriaceae bacterium]|nr:hypothetical protein [Symbiobacteriaceae bacterium]